MNPEWWRSTLGPTMVDPRKRIDRDRNIAAWKLMHILVEGLTQGEDLKGRLVCYVQGLTGDTVYVGDMGVSGLRGVFTRRPNNCRYAVVAIAVPRKGTTKYVVIDLYNLLSRGTGDVLLGPHLVLDTEDAAIAAAQLKC